MVNLGTVKVANSFNVLCTICLSLKLNNNIQDVELLYFFFIVFLEHALNVYTNTSYLYFICTLSRLRLHNNVNTNIFVRYLIIHVTSFVLISKSNTQNYEYFNDD